MTRINTLKYILHELRLAGQFISTPKTYLKHANKAEAFIISLEVYDCGDVGGVDPNNKLCKVTNYDLYDRFLTLVNKENQYSELEDVCGFDIDAITDYFKLIVDTSKSLN